jgi:hypothetical protein
MTNIEIHVDAVEPFAEGRAIGDAGRYLRIRGTAKGELDPNASETASSPISIKPQEMRGV